MKNTFKTILVRVNKCLRMIRVDNNNTPIQVINRKTPEQQNKNKYTTSPSDHT
jgi:hypothetical protein